MGDDEASVIYLHLRDGDSVAFPVPVLMARTGMTREEVLGAIRTMQDLGLGSLDPHNVDD